MEQMSLAEFSQKVGIPEDEIKGRSRKESIAIARELYWLYLYKNGKGYRKISQLDGRKPETILSGIRTIRNLIETNHPLVEQYKELIKSFYNQKQTN
ncbi:hypothetical protein D0T53_10220 [Dysgonomonas sp. 216]|uniref:hypothetical protein n=1 Tax=Dysgonomonas sp. 216 TaxID=2302934 RepID=UPI0013D75B7C|nr:hypothetical protein [Dysgonomonas sp. 216]NDW19287.1 hypothetical protein [Dysgonomonas sp. 216]